MRIIRIKELPLGQFSIHNNTWSRRVMAYKLPKNNMRKLLLFFFATFLTSICCAQAPLSVFGINPNTTMKKFNLELSKKGFKPTHTADGLYEYKVKYAGYSNCAMEVKFNVGNDSVLSISIDIPHESIAKDESIFENLTKQFKEKYGNELDSGEELLKLREEYEGRKIKRTRYVRSYGKHKINSCGVNWYFNDEEYEDGVEVKYYTNARKDGKVSVNSDI